MGKGKPRRGNLFVALIIFIFGDKITMLKKILFVVACALTLTSLSGCNTIHGIGEDVSAGGRAIQKSTQ